MARLAAILALLLTLVTSVGASATDGASATPASPPAVPAAAHESPADQPRLLGTPPPLPDPPPSFNSYDGGWIEFSYPPAVRERVQPLIGEADRFRAEMRERLGQDVLSKVHVRIARTPGEMSTLAPEGAPYPKYASGVAYSEIGLVLLTIGPVYPNAMHDLAEVFRHELAHIALHDAVQGRHQIPRWFNEGFAVHASGESSLSRLQTLWSATLSSNLIPFAQLDRGFPADSSRAQIAYAQSADVVRFLLRQQERERFIALIQRIRAGQSFESALSDAYGLDLPGLEYDWREEVAKRYSFWPVFFSGTIVWLGALGLFVLGYHRRKKRSKKTLERWTEEELAEDRRLAWASQPPSRVHIVFPSSTQPELPPIRPPVSTESDVPKIEHDGSWHTLH